ncbi:MAG: hypothetical protein N0C84_22575 [Candidatus Thiodiazotropha taylori]|uniref:DnaT DNA-binding domain-containing protein n=1 Tax=Candidatus Thiodiazotropha taylori TaxID=2792791 RepID=A0A9E4T6V7_9GAMM|nr:hypothetical protein [Candidatus Thiodiazotropha taylori]MCW4259254.1 hypothetical protein [Candidatus Thiodiazotropha taylori]
MAGDWVKFQVDTFEKPEVIRIADDLGIPEEHVAGCLLRAWCWFDKQSRDGHAANVTEKYIDRITSVTGFANAMQKVGWLIMDGDGLTVPNFDRHNGKSAKSRALAADRKRTERSRNERDKSVTREEKRRSKEKDKKESRSQKFIPPTVEQVAEYVQTREIKINPQAFVDFYKAANWMRGKTKIRDWKACVRTWESNLRETNQQQSKPPARKSVDDVLSEQGY